MEEKKRIIDRFLRYVACDSESGNEQRFCELIQDELDRLGLQTSRDSAGKACGSNGWNVYASLPGEGEPILFCAHLDTVAPGKGILPVMDQKGFIYSKGDTILGADDKAGVSAIVEALEVVLEKRMPHRPIEVLFTICEETGLLGARNADYSRFSSKQAVVFDSRYPQRIIHETPAQVKLHVCVEGKSAHAAVAPEQGIHALKAAAQAVSELPCGRVDDVTVVNIANFLSPGETNVVPDRATFDVEIRSFKEESIQYWILRIRDMVERVCTGMGARVNIDVEHCYGAVFVPEDTPLVSALKKACRCLGLEPKVDRGFGGSDMAWLFANGIQAVNMGVGMIDIHSTDESLCVESMEQTVDLILEMACSAWRS